VHNKTSRPKALWCPDGEVGVGFGGDTCGATAPRFSDAMLKSDTDGLQAGSKTTGQAPFMQREQMRKSEMCERRGEKRIQVIMNESFEELKISL
jgi:hypothetical protein